MMLSGVSTYVVRRLSDHSMTNKWKSSAYVPFGSVYDPCVFGHWSSAAHGPQCNVVAVRHATNHQDPIGGRTPAALTYPLYQRQGPVDSRRCRVIRSCRSPRSLATDHRQTLMGGGRQVVKLGAVRRVS